MFTVRLIQRSATLPTETLQQFSRVLHQYVNTTLERYWGINAAIYVSGNDTAWTDQDFRVVVYDTPQDATQSQVLGQHLWRGRGNPEGYVFIKMCELWGSHWDEVLSHEVIEMLVDPWLSRYAKRGDDFWPVEVCDPVQGGYTILNGFRMSDFVTPAYYQDGSQGPYDSQAKLKAPFSLSEGGFGQVYRNGILTPLYGGNSKSEPAPRNSAVWSRTVSRSTTCVA